MDRLILKLTWQPIEMLDLKHFKEAIVMFSFRSSFVKETLNNWTTQHRVISQDQKGLVTAVLEAEKQLQLLLWWSHKATKIEKQIIERLINVTKQQLLGERHYDDL